jgi:hypothetical protein
LGDIRATTVDRARHGGATAGTIRSVLDDVVTSFLQAVDELVQVDALVRLARAGEIAREGDIEDGTYAIHGAGCRFTRDDGRVVDVDVDPISGATVFDAWRVQIFAGAEVDLQAVEELLRDRLDLVEARPGWFMLAEP